MAWSPKSPSDFRMLRRRIVEVIKAEGLTIEQAAERNRTDGWDIVAPDGSTLRAYRWGKGERAIIARMLETERGH